MPPLPRALYVSSVHPDPHGMGVQQRAFNHLTMLAAFTELHVIAASRARPLPPPPPWSAGCASFQWLPATPASLPAGDRPGLRLAGEAWRWWRGDDGLPSPPYWPAAPRLVFCFRRPAYALVRRHWGRFRGAHLWFDLDDIESVALAGAAALHPPPSLEGRLVARLAVWRNRRAEDRMLDVADTVSVCSAVDRERLRVRRPRASIAVLPNVVSLPPAVPDRVADGTFCVLFVGSMSYGPNEDAALWLAREVLPVLRDRCSQPVTLQLVGRRPRPADARPLTIVDVREPELFAEGHIPGAINRPWPGVKATAATELSKDHAIVLVCHGGPMGDELADILVAAGFTDVRNLEGGMRQWRGPIVPGG